MQLTPNTRYTFDFKDQVQFGDLPIETLYSILRDGRFATEFLARYFEKHFDNLDYKDKKFVDFHHPLGNIEQKQVTSNGFCFAPSKQKGDGRKIDRPFTEALIKEKNLFYLVASITRFPIVYVTLVTGDFILEHFPQTTCMCSSLKKINAIFGFPAE